MSGAASMTVRSVGIEVVGDEDLDTGVRAQASQLADGGREGAGATVGQVVAADAGDDDVLEAHDGDGLRDAARLVGIVPVRTAGLDRAEAAGTRAGVAQDHDGRRALLPALADVGAAGLFADGVERLAAHEVLELLVVGAAGHPGLDPVGMAAPVRSVQPGGVHGAAHGDGQRLEGVAATVAWRCPGGCEDRKFAGHGATRWGSARRPSRASPPRRPGRRRPGRRRSPGGRWRCTCSSSSGRRWRRPAPRG